MQVLRGKTTVQVDPECQSQIFSSSSERMENDPLTSLTRPSHLGSVHMSLSSGTSNKPFSKDFIFSSAALFAQQIALNVLHL